MTPETKSKRLKETPFIPPKELLQSIPNPNAVWDHHYKLLIRKDLHSYELYLPTNMVVEHVKPYLNLHSMGKSHSQLTLKRSESHGKISSGKKRRVGIKCLYVGCGLSNLCNSLVEVSPTLQVEQMDISSVVTKFVSTGTNIRTRTMDVSNMNYDDNSFNVIIEKGTFDSLLSANFQMQYFSAIKEIYRVLKPGGYFISFSCQPSRSKLMKGRKDLHWDVVEVQKIDPYRYNAHYVWMYIVKKWSDEQVHKHENATSSGTAIDVKNLSEILLSEASL